MASGIGAADEQGIVHWLCAPLSALPSRVRWLVSLLLSVVTFGVSALLVRRMDPAFGLPDSPEYLLMAQGRMALARQPFASRPLEPLLAGGLASTLHANVQTGFAILACVSFLFTMIVVFHLAMRTQAPRWVLLAMCAVPFWPQLLHGMALPDVWYAGVLSCLLLFLAADRPGFAALMLFPLMLSRESTSLTLVCLVAVGWRRLGWRGSALAVVASGAGSLAVRHLSAGAEANPEHLPQTLYLIGKAPWNLVRTLGIQPWSNLYPYLCGSPVWQHRLHIGPLQAVGMCSTSTTAPREAMTALLTTYGLLLPLLVVVWRRRAAIPKGDLLLRFSLLYGGISFLLPPLLGTWYVRFFGYAWPLFMVALPRLFVREREGDSSFGSWRFAGFVLVGFLLLHVALGRFAFFFQEPGPLVFAIPLFAAGITLLLSPAGRILVASGRPEPAPAVVKSV